MKIGAFAKKHGVKKSTVRYYVDEKLIVPQKSGTYPDFDANCDEDMGWILSFRNMGFSIDEIASLLIRRRIEQGLTDQQRLKIADLLLAKKRKITEMRALLKKQLLLVEEYSQGITESSNQNELAYGLNFSVADMFSCPVCKSKYRIENASINSSGINSGIMTCECDVSFVIEDGMIMQKRAVKASMDPLPPLSLEVKINEKINDEIRNEYFVELKKTVSIIEKTVSSWRHDRGLLVLNPRRDNFIFQLDQYLRKDGWYYLVHDRLEELQSLREMMSDHPCFDRLIFIHYQDTIPIIDGVSYMFNVGGYGNDLAFGRKVWSIDLLKESMASIAESIYVDYGYYPTSEEYLNHYKNLLPKASIVYENNVPANRLLDNHPQTQMVAIKVFLFKR